MEGTVLPDSHSSKAETLLHRELESAYDLFRQSYYIVHRTHSLLSSLVESLNIEFYGGFSKMLTRDVSGHELIKYRNLSVGLLDDAYAIDKKLLDASNKYLREFKRAENKFKKELSTVESRYESTIDQLNNQLKRYKAMPKAVNKKKKSKRKNK